MPVRTLACIVHSVFTCVGKWYMHHGVKHMGWFSAGHMSNTCTGNGIPWSINHNNVQPQDICEEDKWPHNFVILNNSMMMLAFFGYTKK